MKSSVSQYLPGGRRFPASSGRIMLLGFFISLLYAAGLGMGGWAATLSLAAVRAGQPVAVIPWLLAFAFMIAGMLSVVYGFFFRPRAVEINAEEVAVVKWDGKMRSMRREDVASVSAAGSRIILRGRGREMILTSMYSGWPRLQEELAAWGGKDGGPQGGG